MTCTCGDTMTVDAENREEAVTKFKDIMDEEAIRVHMTEKHPGDPIISVADCHKMIEQTVTAS